MSENVSKLTHLQKHQIKSLSYRWIILVMSKILVMLYLLSYYQVETRCQELPPGPSGAQAEDHCDLEQWLPCVPAPTRKKVHLTISYN